MDTKVDTRFLKSGMVRLRWKLNSNASKLLNQTLIKTEILKPEHALEAICLSYISTESTLPPTIIPQNPVGKNRIKIVLFPDQYEVVRFALDRARMYYKNDAEAVIGICISFNTLNKMYNIPNIQDSKQDSGNKIN